MVSDLNAMRRGSWGHFHELGHNHQQGDWTPDGTGEVTCNIFTLYVFDKVCGIPVEKAREGFSKEEIRQSVRKHLAAGGTFEHWKSDAFLSLIIYVQLQQGFGWETFRKVFAGYQNLPSSERPQTDAAKLALARDTITAMQVEKMFDGMAVQMKQMAAQMAQLPTEATPEQRAAAEALQGKVMDLVMASAKGTIAKMDQIYADVYSEAELKAMKTFFSSPEGRSMQEIGRAHV